MNREGVKGCKKNEEMKLASKEEFFLLFCVVFRIHAEACIYSLSLRSLFSSSSLCRTDDP